MTHRSSEQGNLIAKDSPGSADPLDVFVGEKSPHAMRSLTLLAESSSFSS
jgi:hypothetical protein